MSTGGNSVWNIAWAAAFGVVFGLLGAGLLYLAARPANGNSIKLLPAPTPAPLVVSVSGAVIRPGLQALPKGSRVQDAILAAGGLTGEAEETAINPAALLKDGDQITVPVKGSQPLVPAGAKATHIPTPAAVFPININTATVSELDALPGIGPVTAGEIIAYRQAHGPFKTIEDIQNVKGIGPATFERIKELITVQAAEENLK